MNWEAGYRTADNSAALPSREVRLLSLCARTSPDDDLSERIKDSLKERIDWEEMVQLANRHRILPLLYKNLNRIDADAVPLVWLERLRDHYHANSLRNLRLARELLRILKAFESEGVETTAIKGPALAISVYGSLSLRQFADLDILVHPRNLSRGRELLSELAYQPIGGLADWERSIQSRWGNHWNFISAASESAVELHWRLLPRWCGLPRQTDRCWERRESAFLLGDRLLTLGAEDTLLFLCAHGAKHGWGWLNGVCDIAELLRARPDIDWDLTFQTAREWGCLRRLSLGLSLARDLLDADSPPILLRKEREDTHVAPLAKFVSIRLFLSQEIPKSIRLATALDAVNLRSMERLQERNRLRYFLFYRFMRKCIAPSAKDRAALFLPDSLSFLYYLVRPLRIGIQRIFPRSLSAKKRRLLLEDQETINFSDKPRSP